MTMREKCCKDLRRYLETALAGALGDVVSVKTSRVAPNRELRWSYGQCLASLLRRYRLRTTYVLTRAEAEELLRNLDTLCAAKPKKEKKKASGKPRHRPPIFGEKMVRISFHLPRQMRQMLDDYVAELKTTRSAVIRYAISEMLERIRKEQVLLLAQATP
jgi:hypothetical protein